MIRIFRILYIITDGEPA